MSMLTDLIARLSADSDISNLTSTRIRLNRAAQGDALPRIVIHLIGSDHEHHLTAATGFVQARVQIDCNASYPYIAENLAEFVRQSLDGFRGLMGSTFISTLHLDDERMLRTPPNAGADDSEGVDTKQMDFIVGWRVPVPTFS